MRNRFLKLLMTLMLASTLHPGVAQNDEMSEEETSGYIPTPQTWAFIKYGNSPVDYYTGTAQVNVPIYDYADNDFQFSISAGYASTGFMPQRQTGILGLNWFLNCGGSITREIKGFPDDKAKKRIKSIMAFYWGVIVMMTMKYCSNLMEITITEFLDTMSTLLRLNPIFIISILWDIPDRLYIMDGEKHVYSIPTVVMARIK